MISWLLDAVHTTLMLPMTLDTVPDEDRCTIDEIGGRTLVGDNELVISHSASQPLDSVIGGGGTLRHNIQVDLTCADGDLLRARTRRDRLTTRLLMPAMRDPSLAGAADDGTTSGLRQDLTKLTWSVQWADLQGGTPESGLMLAAFASVSFTADADWWTATLTP